MVRDALSNTYASVQPFRQNPEVPHARGDVSLPMVPFPADDLTRHVASLRALARDLLADDTLADDAVQQACVTALVRPPSGPVSVAAWLRAVVRSCAFDLWRTEQRRRRREQLVARDDGVESRDAAEQLELQEDIVAAVRSLDEPYRTAVWLRYYEHRSPAAIARLLGEPVKTVKTRLWRALQLLRRMLDGRYGSRGTWAGALVPFAHAGTGMVVAGIAKGGLLMEGKKLLLAGVVLVVAIAGTAVAWPRDAVAVTPPAAGAPVASAIPQAQAETPPAATPAVREEAAASASPFGSLVVRVLWHDRTPAPGVAIHCVLCGEAQLDRNELRLVADARGVAHASRVPAGNVELSSDRGGRAKTTVAGGSVSDVDFVLPRGIDVAGTVIDEHQRPVADAQIVLVSPRGGWLGGRVIAASDAGGAFAVRAVDPKWSLGARAARYAPSRLVDLEGVTRPADALAVQIRLELMRPGATVAGVVVDQSGTPVAGATVVLGRGMGGHYEPPITRESWSPHVADTGDDGAFRCDGVEPGEQPIDARADGCTRASSSVTCVAGQTAQVTLVVARGFVVRGTVRDEKGSAVAGAIVTSLDPLVASFGWLEGALSERRELKRPRTRSDAAGRFELRSVPEGAADVIAATQGGSWGSAVTASCSATLSGRAGDELAWDPVLTAGKTLRVRLVDEHGKPAHYGTSMLAYAEQPAGLATALSVLVERDTPGLFVFPNCADVPYTVGARVHSAALGTRWVYVHGVVPGGLDVELLMPAMLKQGSGEVTGRIVDAGNRLAGRAAEISLSTSVMRVRAQLDGDRFTARQVPPGRWFVWLQADGEPVVVGPTFELQDGQQLDIGDVVTEPGGTLRVALRTNDGATIDKPAADLDSSYRRQRLKWDGTHLVATNATVGRHRVQLSTPGWHAPPRDVEVTAGGDSVVTLDVAPASHRRFRFTMPFPDQWQRCEFALRDAAGNVVSADSTTTAATGIEPHWWQAPQPFGQFTLEAVVDGVRRAWPVDLRDAGSAGEPLRFSLR